ncbi:MAG: GNAT family N-acetyltransferase [Candidatus Eisenbacteria bacterium]|nr:GNAT family N-acetyltransferase [Candidatus Eisenbacteria bacterium]
MKSGFVIRPFDGSDEDYQAIVDVWNASFPDELINVETRRHHDEHLQKQFLFERLVGEIDGTPVLNAHYGEDEWSHLPGKYRLGIQVVPEYRRMGFGRATYDYIWDRIKDRDPKPTLLACYAREDDADSMRFVEKRGFKVAQRNQFSMLDVRAFDPKSFAEALTGVDASDVDVRPFGELMAEDDDALHKAYEAGWEFLQDVPFPEPIQKWPFEQYLAEVQGPWGMPESWFIAVDGGRYVGMSQLWKIPAQPGRLQTGLTGVARTHRRRGLATALKVRAISGAKEAGYESIRTDNEENNPMYALNVKLGFKPIPSWLAYRNELK